MMCLKNIEVVECPREENLNTAYYPTPGRLYLWRDSEGKCFSQLMLREEGNIVFLACFNPEQERTLFEEQKTVETSKLETGVLSMSDVLKLIAVDRDPALVKDLA